MRMFGLTIAAIGVAGLALGITAINSAAPPSELPKMAAACATCHGANGEGNEARSAPPLAGLDAKYLASQLSHFTNGKRGDHQSDKFGSQMSAISRSLKENDIAAISEYYAGLDFDGYRGTLSGDNAKGKQLYANCAACHGEKGEGNLDLSAPKLAGQADWYILRSLMTYKAGGRGYAKDDTLGQQMVQAAQSVESEADAKDIAAYIGSLSSR